MPFWDELSVVLSFGEGIGLGGGRPKKFLAGPL